MRGHVAPAIATSRIIFLDLFRVEPSLRDDSALDGSPHLAAGLTPSEAERVAALRSYGVLDTPREPAFEDITRLASYVCGTPFAVVNLIDSGRQWFKAEIGFGIRETPLDTSICAHAILQPGLFVVEDLSVDPRFACNPLITGEPSLRFYAGALLQTPDGHALGTVCVLDTQPRRLSDEQGQLLLGLARQTMAQLELRKALILAERAARYRGQLMAVAGHDLRQPLQVITSVLERQGRRAVDESDRKRLDGGLQAARRLAADLESLARASDLQNDSGGPDVRPLQLSDVFRRVEAAWAGAAAGKGLALTMEPCNVTVVSDGAMLATILGNLVGNAIKYTDTGGVTVRCVVGANHADLQVIDTGPGIPPERLAGVFEAFNQIDSRSEGLGLGLAIVRRTAELLDHPASVNSELGVGSTFTILTPLG